MTASNNEWAAIQSSGYGQPGDILSWTEAESRPLGALRYQCPITDSYVIVTDDAAIAALDRPRAQVSCPSCGEQHLLMREGADAAIVAAQAAS